MKKLILGLLMAAVGSISASAAPINVTVGFAVSGFVALPNSTTAASITSVNFSLLTFNAPACVGTSAALCDIAGVTLDAANLTNAGGNFFMLGSGADALKYTLNAGWTVTGNASDGFVIKTTGVYSTANASDGPTSGTMNFSIQPPTDPTTGSYNFSASGKIGRAHV